MNRRTLLRGAVLALALRPFKDLVGVEVDSYPRPVSYRKVEIPALTRVDSGGPESEMMFAMYEDHFVTYEDGTEVIFFTEEPDREPMVFKPSHA